MKKLWDKDYELNVFSPDLSEQARTLDRPVLQDIANVLRLVVNCKGDWMLVFRHVIPQIIRIGPAHTTSVIDVDGASGSEAMAFVYENYSMYAVELVSFVRDCLKSERLKLPEMVSKDGCTFEDLMTTYCADDLDDLACSIARHIDYTTSGIEHPWVSTNIITRNSVKVSRMLKWWTND